MARTPKTIRLTLGENATGQGLMLTTFAMLALGVVMVYSAVASVSRPGLWYERVDIRHTLFAVLACAVLCTLRAVDYNRLSRGKRFPVIPGVLLAAAIVSGAIVFVPGVGHAIGGRVRWIRIGPPQYAIGFQPSELIKLALLIFLAAWLTRPSCRVRSFGGTFVPAMALIGLCVGLIVREDFGAGGIIAITACVTLLFAGVPWYYFLLLIAPAAGVIYKFVISDPQRWARVEAMINPWAPTAGAYQSRQSLLAVINGGWNGKGLGKGVQKLGFLPEDSTDFIFSVFCEEWGFIGAVLLMGLVATWIWHARRSAVRAANPFGRVLSGSLGFLIAFQAVLHIAVDLVAVPPTGVSLPFISAGGTALVLMAAAAALIVSVSAGRQRPAGQALP